MENKVKTSLVIMAAGIGSRFGKGIKQLESVGPNGELIIDYSIRDAVNAGFDRVVFIIRHDLEEDFRRLIGDRTEEFTEVAYAFQELSDIPEGYGDRLEGRTKPWGTGQAVLCCKDIVKEPFLVINADDYYGKEAYKMIHDFLVRESEAGADCPPFCMAGYQLKNTLSDFGSVTRGVCEMDSEGFLSGIEETYHIVRTEDGAASEAEDGTRKSIDPESLVSMNMWGFFPDFFRILEDGFVDFLEKLPADEKKKEYLLPILIGELIRDGKVRVRVLPTKDSWFGVTYQEDKEIVRRKIREMLEEEANA